MTSELRLTGQHRARLLLEQRHLRVLTRALHEAIAADLLRAIEVQDAHDLLALAEAKLPSAPERHRAGAAAGRLMLRDDILRVLDRAENAGRLRLSVPELDDKLADKPDGTRIRETLRELGRDKLVTVSAVTHDVALTRAGRARARRVPAAVASEHAVSEPDQLLELIVRAARHPSWSGSDDLVEQTAIWHVPMVQGVAGVDAEGFDRLTAALEADGMIGERHGSYRTLTQAGRGHVQWLHREHRPPGMLYEPRLLPAVRRPRELIRRREDAFCPACGRLASWLKTRKGKRYEELRHTGATTHDCVECGVSWSVYAEPVARDGSYDPFAAPTVCRPRWAYGGGYLRHDCVAPPDHWSFQ